MESALKPSTPEHPIDPALEKQYNLRIRHPERTAVYDRFAASSAAFRAAHPQVTELRYDDGPRCVLDFFHARATAPAPLFVFIHGGYWRALDRSIFSFLARPWLDRGAHVALVGYDLAPSVTVHTIVAEVRKALGTLRQRAAALRCDIGHTVIGGHSAGAHLGACALADDSGWHARGFVGISGVYDLQPLLATSVNNDVRMSAADARALSPLHLPMSPATRYVCAVGADETDGFRAQSHMFAAHLRRQRCDAVAIEIPRRNHFDILDDLADPDHSLFRQAHALLADPTH